MNERENERASEREKEGVRERNRKIERWRERKEEIEIPHFLFLFLISYSTFLILNISAAMSPRY